MITPAVSHFLEALRRRFDSWSTDRVSYVIVRAAKIAGVDPDVVVNRLADDPAKRELLVRTLRVAQDSAMTEHLAALAQSLANGGQYADPGEVAWETAFVRALGDCDRAHLDLLECFVQTSNDLGLGDGSTGLDSVPDGLNRQQLDMVRPGLKPLMDALLSTLERHGLLRAATTTGGLSFGIGSSNLHWRMTEFGHAFLQRMNDVGMLLSNDHP